MNKTIIGIVVILVVALGAWYFMSQPQIPVVNETENGGNVEASDEAANIEKNTITFTGNGFSPSVVTAKKGDTVKFVNNSAEYVWPASAMHPTHTVYPGSDIEKCDTDARDTLFDSCEGIAPGASWEFTFNEVGEWGYHDHLNAKFFGKVIVE